MKTRASVVVIGGGILGCSVAYHLAKRVKDVVLLERDGIASHASGSNYGMIWTSGGAGSLGGAVVAQTIPMYEELVNEVFDIDIEWEYKGGLALVTSEGTAKAVQQALADSSEPGGDPAEFLWAEDIRDLEPNISHEVLGGVWYERAAQLNPMLTVLALARAARRLGVEVNTRTEAIDILVDRGRVTGVRTTKGDIETDVVVNAAGPWARKLAGWVGVDLPVWPHQLQSLVTAKMPRVLSRTISGYLDIPVAAVEKGEIPPYSFRRPVTGPPCEERLPREPMEDSVEVFVKPTVSGNIVLGSTFQFAGLDTWTPPRAWAAVARRAARLFPSLRGAQIIRSYAKCSVYTFDNIPVLGRVPQVEGFILATGSDVGMIHGLPIGNAVADLIVDGNLGLDLDEVGYERNYA